jgi:hypothetical protein
MRGDTSRSFHVTALEQVQGCSGTTTRSVSRGMILLLQLEEFLRPRKSTEGRSK